jgi:glycosyltransferase involved in cell wall biosynthesis
MPSFTLIIPTLGRTLELNALFASVALQDVSALECVVVDQNTDGRLDEVIAQWEPRINIRRLRGPVGASRSRNLGLLHATGDIIAFPDDDCWYSPRLLKDVDVWFEQHPGMDILTVGARDHDGVPSGNRWPQERCKIRPINAFRTTFCSSIFLRRTAACTARFDEAIGPGAGSPWGCGEETDYVLQLLRNGARGVFDRRGYVGHPKRDMLSGEIDSKRAAGYGRGMGYVLRKHALYLLGVAFVFYDLLRSVVVLLKGDRKAAALCAHHARGIVSGLRFSNSRKATPEPTHVRNVW